jgi:hypothetical protein
MPKPVVVFISYSQDSAEHREKVLRLAERLRQDGLDARLDQHVNGTPEQGWPRWMLDQLDEASFVLVVCTETYYRRFRGHDELGRGKGADWEGSLITQEIYDARSRTVKFVPVMFAAGQQRFIPEPLRPHTHYELTSEEHYQALYAFLLGQAGVELGAIGQIRPLSKQIAQPLTFGPTSEALPAPIIQPTLIGVPQRNPHFAGRKELLSRLHQKLQEPGVGPRSPVEIHGRPGIGKTQLVIEYIYRFGSHYRFVLWVVARSVESLRLAYLSIARAVGLNVAQADIETAVRAVKAWLSHEYRWLLVFDGATDLDMVRTYLPRTMLVGRVLIISQTPLSNSSIEIETMEAEDAVKFIIERTEKTDANAAAALAEELDYLPLALVQAASYIKTTGSGLVEYIAKYRREGVVIAAKGKPIDRRSAETTWNLSFDAVRELSPASAELLIGASFLMPDSIPIEIFIHGGSKLGGLLPHALQGAAEEPLIFWNLLKFLERYSLVERLPGNRFKLHTLTRELVLDSLGYKDRTAWVEKVIQAFNMAYSRMGPITYLPIIATLYDLASDMLGQERKIITLKPNGASFHALRYKPSSWSRTSSDVPQLRKDLSTLLGQILEIQELILGRKHPATTITTWILLQLANLLNDREAAALMTQKLRGLLRHYEDLSSDQRLILESLFFNGA